MKVKIINLKKYIYKQIPLIIMVIFTMLLTLNFNYEVNAEENTYEFDYTGNYQEFTATKDGIYNIQLWGAQGGNYDTTLYGGLGGYTSGNIKLTKGQKLYFYVGAQASSSQTNLTGGWNGGGNVPSGKDKDGRAGGGATDVRTIKTSSLTTWNETASLASRIMVAGGGGGAAYESSATWRSNGGAGGGLIGLIPTSIGSSAKNNYGTGGSQTVGGHALSYPTTTVGIGTFGQGGRGISTDGGSGGGSGWYGGGGSGICSGGGGGSSYISGHNGCIAVDSSGNTINTKKVKTDPSYSWTNFIFTNTKVIDGEGYEWTSERQDTIVKQPTYDNKSTQVGNSGNGYAKIQYVRKLSTDNTLKSITSDIGTLSPSFSSSEYEYDLIIDKEQTTAEISAETTDENATITGLGKYSVKYSKTNEITLTVTSESGTVQVYKINLKRDTIPEGTHTTDLAELEFTGTSSETLSLTPSFNTNITEYSTEIEYTAMSIELEAIPYDPTATVKIDGNDLIIEKSGQIKITVSAANCNDKIYIINYTRGEKPQNEYVYEYTGDYQEFIASSHGKYTIELWGAQGAQLGSFSGGKGAYTKGDIILNKGEKLYIYVGNNETHAASFNGGAIGTSYASSGGGATDIRLVSGNWNDFDSLKSRIMVAAGGGGATIWSSGSYGGAAGGLFAYDVPYYATGSWGYTLNTGATQTSGGVGFVSSNAGRHGQSGKFGIGGNGNTSSGYGGGGGGGYYGGAGGGDGGPMTCSGSGGSSYISGHIGCDSIDESSTSSSIIHTENNIHYSNKYFTNTLMIDGLGYSWTTKDDSPTFTEATSNGLHATLDSGEYVGQPTTDNTGIQEGQEGNGYAKITPLFLNSKNNYLSNITASSGTFTEEFSPTKYEYNLILDKSEREVEIFAQLADSTATINGVGKYKVRYGKTTVVTLSVTSESGDIRVYKVNITRKPLESNEHSSLLADLDFKLEEDEIEPDMEPIFNSNTTNYKIIIAPNTITLDFEAIPFDEEATVKMEGNGLVINDSGKVTITVTEPNTTATTYTINYERAQTPADEYNYEYTGDYQEFIAPVKGKYRFELWGAQGANLGSKHGGYGAYTKGEILLEAGEKLYIYVGNNEVHAASFNGGALGTSYASSGGGATDIRLVSGNWNNFESLKSRIMVAAGGGGATIWGNGSNGGAAGGLFSYDVPYYASGNWGYTLNTGATQTSGGVGFISSYSARHGESGSFGKGGHGNTPSGYGGGGGGGYYGGSGGGDGGPMTCSGSGGSSYISGHAGSNSIKESSTEEKIIHTSENIHYSNKYFTNTLMIDGLGYSWKDENSSPNYTAATANGSNSKLADGEYSGQPTTDGTSIQEGQKGNGYAKITPLFASKNNYLVDLSTNYGTFDKEFDPYTYTYTLTLDKYETNFTLSGTLADKNATVTGLGKYEIDFGETKNIDIVVTAPNGEIRTYKIVATRPKLAEGEHSTKLLSLTINNNKYNLNPEFISKVTDYELEVPYSTVSLDVIAIPYDDTATVTIKGNGYISVSKSNEITITVTHPDEPTTVYKIKVTREKEVEGQEYRYSCTNTYQKFTAPGSTYYKVQLWGAAGGYGRTNWSIKYRGGYGAYTEGEIYLQKGQELYVYVGCSGGNSGMKSKYSGGVAGFNGGATGGNDSNQDSQPEPGGGGGGATDIRLVPTSKETIWNEFNSLKSRIMIAAGGGGGNYSGIGGAGGTIEGTTGYGNKKVPTQTEGYAFGYGMPGGSCSDGSGGAGGGYFGGYSGTGCSNGGGGGSSFVSGCKDCISIKEESADSNIVSSDDNIHYSGYYFDKIEMLSGDETQPNPTGGYQNGNNGDGYAIITASKNRSENNFLSEITVDKGTLSPEFTSENLNYNVKLSPDEDEITIGAKLEDDTATLTGTGTFDVPSGSKIFSITVTSESGDIRIYNITVEREKSSNSIPANIVISGLIPTVCSVNSNYCKLDQEFDPEIHTYTMTVPSRIKQLQFTVQKSHKYQTVTGDGIVSLQSGMNTFTIEITSEDGKNISSYTYNIDRDMNGNANIETLEVIDPEVNINFDPDITEYYFSVPNDYTSIGLKVVLEDEKATYKIVGNENFETGLNIIQINVTAQNGETQTYLLNVYREQSGNTFLTELKVTGVTSQNEYPLSPTYNKIISNYTVNVPYEEEKVKIEATAEHTLTTITSLGEKTLKTGTNNIEITSTSEDGSIQIYKLSIIRAKSSDATLKSLDVLEATLSPSFDSNTENYNIDVNPGVTFLNINAVVNNENAKYTIVGNNGFKVGLNIVKIVVTAEDGSQKIYTLNVNRKASSNTYLSSLTIDKYDMSSVFDKEIETYNITFEDKTPSIKVSATPEDELSKVSNTGVYNLKTGHNEISIVVTAEDGSTRTYTINVFQEASSNNNLLSLSTSSTNSYTPTFSKNTTKYSLTVENSEDKITLLGVAEDKNATVKGNGEYSLDVGDNAIDIIVEAENGDLKTYTINITRKASSNAYATQIIAKESVLDPVFNKNTTSYELRVLEEVTSLTLTVDLEDSNATYEIIGNENFVIGHNTVTVKVTAQDKTVKSYVLDVLRQAKGTTSNKLDNLTVDQGVLTPSFDPEINYYEVEVPYSVTKIKLDGELDDKNATVTGFGEHNLIVGKNVLAVTVTSTENIVRHYQVIVTRKENDEARLSSIQITSSTLSPNFNKDIYEYNVKTTLTELNINAVTIDKNATYEIIGNKNLQLGNNQIIIRVTAANKETTKDYILNVEREKSNNNNLKSLEIEGVDYTPEFSKTTTVYYANVDKDINTIQIKAEAEDINATVQGAGEVELLVGKNYVEIKVTSESGNEKVYTIIVTRQASNNNYLSSLITSAGTLEPTFDKTVNDYKVTVDNEIEDIVISGTLEDKNATVTGLDKYNLQVGENKIQVTVTAEDGSINIYTIVVTREEIVSSKLKNLTIKDYELDQKFNKDVYDYNVTIDNEVTSLDLTVETLDKNATYEIIGNKNFIVGMNTVKIIVTDSKGIQQTTYILNVNRQNYANTYLSYIYTDQGTLTPTFEKNTLTYEVEVENNIEEINVFAEPEITSNTLTGTGKYTLSPGKNKVSLTVTTQTGIKRVYYVNIIRKQKTNNSLTSLVIKANEINQELVPNFDKDVLEYESTVDKTVTTVQIIATAEDGATISGTGIKQIKAGENTFEITVTSESGLIKVYTVTITRDASSNNNLTSIIPSVGTLSPEFTPDQQSYTLNLDSSSSMLYFTVATEDPFAKVTGIETQIIPDGESTRQIVVEAEDKSTKIYTIHVYKERTDEARLSSLSIEGYSLNEEFDKDKYSYTITVPNSKKVLLSSEVLATPLDKNATAEKTDSLTLKAGEISIYTIIVTAKDGFTTQTYTIAIEREKGTEALLSKLNFAVGKLSPDFSSSVTNYTLVVPNTIEEILDTDVEAEATDEDATVEKLEKLSITGNNDKYLIKVISNDKKNTTTYTVNVVYDQSNDASLKSLTVKDQTLIPEFSKDILEYTVNVLDTIQEVNVEAIVNDPKATIIGGTGIHNLTDYSTKINVTVQAEDGSINIYTITVVKSITTEKLLSDLYLSGDCDKNKCPLNQNFDENTFNYTTTIENEYSNINIETIKKHDNQIVKIYNEKDEEISNLNYQPKVGENKLRIEITNGVGDVTNYTLTITRKPSSNNYLSDLKITDPSVELEFNKDTLEYFANIPSNYDKVVLDYKTESSSAKVVVSGSTYLNYGNNNVTIKVIAENGDIRTYIIHVVRNAEYNNYLQSLTVSSGTIYNLEPKFNKTTKDYIVEVPYQASKVTIDAVAEEKTTTVVGTGEKDLKVGLNTYTITTTAITGETTSYNVIIKREKSNRLYLKNLEIENATLKEEFNKETFTYNVDALADVNKLSLLIEPEDETTTYKVIGNNNLITGKNTVLIVLENMDKTVTTTYKLIVNKQASGDNYLKSLKVNNKELITSETYDSTIFNIDLDEEIDFANIEAISSSNLATIDGTGKYSLEYGQNAIKVVVTAEDGTKRRYTLNIKREYDIDLLMITTNRGEVTPEFDKDTLEYKLEVERDIEDITVIGVQSSNLTTVEGNGFYKLEVGDNKIDLKVSAQDGTSKTYTVNVIRKKSNNNYLSHLYIQEAIMKEEFNKKTQEYHVEVPDNINSLNMDIELESSLATYEVIGNENLKQGKNTVTIKVTAENNEIRIYNIEVTVQEAAKFSNRLKSLTVNKGTLTPNFDPDTQSYTVTVTNSVENITVSGVLESVEATVEGFGSYSLIPGRNEIKVIVTSKDKKTRCYSIIVYRIESSDARLKNVKFNEGTLNPLFDKDNENYTMTVSENVTSLTATVEPLVEGTTYKIIGAENLQSGTTTVTIEATAEDKVTKKNYIINVTKEISTNNYLETLTSNIGQITPEFEKTNTGPYIINVDNSVNSIILSGKKESISSTVEGLGIHNLNKGKNIIPITVTSQSGSVRVYTVVVNKGLSSDNTLSTLAISEGDLNPAFNKETTEYTVDLKKEVDEVTVLAIANDKNATVTGNGNYKLKTGENKVEIIVTAEDGNTKTYTIIFNKKEEASSKLLDIKANEGKLTPEFDKDTLDYIVTVPNEINNLTLNITKEDENATYEVTGNNNFKVGNNKVEIVVTATDGTKTTYTLNVIKQESSNNYLKSLTVGNEKLVPEFSRETIYYEVEVNNTTTEINIDAIAEDKNATVTGTGIQQLQTGENYRYIEVESSTGVKRVYTVKITRAKSTSNKLKTLTVNEGELTPEFDKDINSYTLEVGEGITQVEIQATAEDENTALVTGTGIKNIVTGENKFEIIVTAEDGSVNTYIITINKKSSSNTNVINIIPSSGILSPAYNNEISNYEVVVDEDVSMIDFEVILESNSATVKNNQNNYLNYGSNDIVIEIEAEDKTKKDIHINVIRDKTITDIIVESPILMEVGEVKTLTPTIIPTDAISKDLIWESSDETVVSVSDGRLEAKRLGDATITVYSSKNKTIKKQIQVSVLNLKITSDIYDIRRGVLNLNNPDEIQNMIIGAEPGEKLNTLLSKLNNKESLIKFYNSQNEEITSLEDTTIATGQIIKLEYNDKIYDQVYIIVRGDNTSDGLIDVDDLSLLVKQVLGKEKYSTDTAIFKSSDVEETDEIDVDDSTKLTRYILGKLKLMN